MQHDKIPNFLKDIPRPWSMLAPMVSNSEEAYRDLARRYGAQICYTEMVHCRIYNEGRSKPTSNLWYTTSETDRPLVIQICGNNPEEMLKTCMSVEKHCDAIDINFGCPQEIARKGFYGSFLMDDWDLVGTIVRHLSANISVPLFCKIRVYPSIEKTVEYAKMIERNGCALLVVHGRTREQRGRNTGYASYEHMRAVKNSLQIPVVANGGMILHENIKECLDYTGCDGIMIAEPHLYNPTIFVGDTMEQANAQENVLNSERHHCNSEVVTAIDILREYLSIIAAHPIKASQKHLKSHFFKILNRILEQFPEFRAKLDDCHSVGEYGLFLDELNRVCEENGVDIELLRMRPYIRKEYVANNK